MEYPRTDPEDEIIYQNPYQKDGFQNKGVYPHRELVYPNTHIDDDFDDKGAYLKDEMEYPKEGDEVDEWMKYTGKPENHC